MVTFNGNGELIVEIYKYISPILIWIEIMKNNFTNDGFKQTEFFQLLKQIRNEISHFDISQNEKNESLFIKIVMIYKRFGLNLIEISFNIRWIWNDLHRNTNKKGFVLKLKSEVESIKLYNSGIYKDYLNSFKSILLSILNPNNRNQYEINLIEIIFQYISPIIIWHEQMINANETNSKLFKLVKEIKNRVCHLSDWNYENSIFLKEILNGILVIYKLFGVDLKSSNSTIYKIDFENISFCIEYKENEIRNEIIRDLKNESYMKNYYLSLLELIKLLIVKVVLNVSFNIESVFDVKEERKTNMRHKIVRDHTTIDLNNANQFTIDGLKTSKTKSDCNTCFVFKFIIGCILFGAIIYFVIYVYKSLGF